MTVALSKEVRLLRRKWEANTGWPKRLSWLEIDGLRGWSGQRFELRFPIMAIVGENGAGKSTVLQAAASVYASEVGTADRYAFRFFPDTTWDDVEKVEIGYEVREGTLTTRGSIRKPGTRWRGNMERRKRNVEYIDLSRIQPVSARVGYTRLANRTFKEVDATAFEVARLARLNEIMGRHYDLAKMATTDGDANRRVPVLVYQNKTFSGFHQGAGETTIAELLETDIPAHSLVLIDEVESSLHPRAQRRLIRDLAERCRLGELQVILTTHSPYVLQELPLEARAYILQTPSGRDIVYGVSPEFAMSKMDEVHHYECDLYVEDERAETMLIEILTANAPSLVLRCETVPCGAASVGKALGQMVSKGKFPRPSGVFLDGDNEPAPGCWLLPGGDAPERVVMDALKEKRWIGLAERVGRDHPDVVDACDKAMLLTEHHDWVRTAAGELVLGSDGLWQAMCALWSTTCLDPNDAEQITQAIDDLLSGAGFAPMPEPIATAPTPVGIPVVPEPEPAPTESEPQFARSLFGDQH